MSGHDDIDWNAASAAFDRLLVPTMFQPSSQEVVDRANLQPVPARTVHTLGARLPVNDTVTVAAEIRNLTDNQVADLWGYPLPGRAAFLAIDLDLSLSGN